MAVVLIVSGGKTHIGDLAAIAIERKSALVTLVFESSIALVHIQIVRRGIVRHQQVRLAIPVHVRKQNTQAVISVGIVHPQFLADIGKGSVAIVMKEMVLFALQAAWAAHRLHSAVLEESITDRL